MELHFAMRRGVARAKQLCEAATVEENAGDGVVLAESVSGHADGDEDIGSDEKLPPPTGGVAPNCRGGKAPSRAAMRVGGRRRQSAKRQHKTFDPGGSAVGADFANVPPCAVAVLPYLAPGPPSAYGSPAVKVLN
eukprot:COSAG05_NODE_1581_length_4493_cov_5.173191_1_plen_135_part_00